MPVLPSRTNTLLPDRQAALIVRVSLQPFLGLMRRAPQKQEASSRNPTSLPDKYVPSPRPPVAPIPSRALPAAIVRRVPPVLKRSIRMKPLPPNTRTTLKMDLADQQTEVLSRRFQVQVPISVRVALLQTSPDRDKPTYGTAMVSLAAR